MCCAFYFNLIATTRIIFRRQTPPNTRPKDTCCRRQIVGTFGESAILTKVKHRSNAANSSNLDDSSTKTVFSETTVLNYIFPWIFVLTFPSTDTIYNVGSSSDLQNNENHRVLVVPLVWRFWSRHGRDKKKRQLARVFNTIHINIRLTIDAFDSITGLNRFAYVQGEKMYEERFDGCSDTPKTSTIVCLVSGPTRSRTCNTADTPRHTPCRVVNNNRYVWIFSSRFDLSVFNFTVRLLHRHGRGGAFSFRYRPKPNTILLLSRRVAFVIVVVTSTTNIVLSSW